MSSNERIYRLLKLLDVLQSGRSFNSVQLAQECGVSRRTIFRDLRTLQHSGLPVVYDGARQGYLLKSSVYIPPTDFTLEEALSLAVLCDRLGDADTGIPFLGPARSAALKVLSGLPGRLRELVGEFADNVELRPPAHNRLEGSQQVYALLTGALAKRLQVRIAYNSLMPDESREISTLLSPYRILFGRRAWYVIGRSSLHRAVRTFHLGRVRKAELLTSTYAIPARFSLDKHLGNAWFLIREPGKRYNVTIRFQPLVARNVAEVQWHRTQSLKWNRDGTLDFRVRVDGLREIQWWVLGYGDQAEVLKPKALRDDVLRRIEAMRSRYE
ncbi:MAG: helix-turn-helix transcriptional regulator [Planctomycetaceae bacterium]